MDKNIIIFLIKLFGTFIVLSLIIIIGKQLKSSEALKEPISYGPMYLESVAEIDKLHKEIELQIQLENEERARVYNNRQTVNH